MTQWFYDQNEIVPRNVMIELDVVHKTCLVFDGFGWHTVMTVGFMQLPLRLGDKPPANQTCGLFRVLANIGFEGLYELLVLGALEPDTVAVLAHLIKHTLAPLIPVVLGLFERALHYLPLIHI